ncbi:MAG: integrase arm-type DNA-binding domain-containing protein [Desulfuromonadales bacterium]|nr:integrase arm-type DNA-binding domain-containing protein [Desulfuromonadales bacterium]
MALSDTAIKGAKAQEKPFKMYDSGGLFLIVTPTGGKWWRFKYRAGGKEKLLSLGTYPEVSLAEARAKKDAARKQVAAGVDPSEARKEERLADAERGANTFEVVARDWLTRFSATRAETTQKMITGRLERDVFPWIGNRPIADLKAKDLLEVLRRLEARGTLETAHRVRNISGQIFRYAVSTGKAERDPTADLRGAIPPVKTAHHAALTDPAKIPGLLRAMDAYDGSFVVKCALRLAPLVFVRPGELRQAEWAEIDLEAGEWNIPAARMKMGIAHLVPLSWQAAEIIQDLRPLTGHGRYVFPSVRSTSRPMSNNAINAALRRMGYGTDEMTGHGFRAMARTILDEVLQVRPDFIEHQLAHTVRGSNGKAYNRTTHLAERKKMMQLWADYLDGLKVGAKVIPLKVKGQ